MKLFLSSAVSVLALAIASCNNSVEIPSDNVDKMVEAASPSGDQVTVQDAKEFLENAEKEKSTLNEYQARVDWVNNNFITEDTNWLAAKASEQASLLDTRLANEAKQFNGLSLPDDMRRKMDGLKRASNFPAPERQGAAKELSEIMTGLNAAYGTGKFEYEGEMITLTEASDIIAESDDPEVLQAIWEGWRTISVPMKDDYARMVEIVNEGSQELGYADAGALWRGGYDMDADEFIAETTRLWEQVKPLYDQLHCNVRAELNKKYGDEVVPLDEPIRADLLGNMWAQQWGNVYEAVAPEGAAEGVDTTQLLEDNDYDALKMVQTAEKFFTSMGFEPLPETFYERSLITKPEDREVVCHASAWDIDEKDDIRIKMCTKVNGRDRKSVV